MAKIDPNIGPIQGVQPNANVNPKTYAAMFLSGVLTLPLNLHSLSNIGKRRTPRKWIPNRIIKPPDKYLISFLKIKKIDPMELATNPSRIKTVDSPREKAIEQ